MELNRRKIHKENKARARRERERALFADQGCDLERYIAESISSDPEFARLFHIDFGAA